MLRLNIVCKTILITYRVCLTFHKAEHNEITFSSIILFLPQFLIIQSLQLMTMLMKLFVKDGQLWFLTDIVLCLDNSITDYRSL